MTDIWIVEAYHDKDKVIMSFIGSFKRLKQVLKEETERGNYNGGFLIYTEKTWDKYRGKERK